MNFRHLFGFFAAMLLLLPGAVQAQPSFGAEMRAVLSGESGTGSAHVPPTGSSESVGDVQPAAVPDATEPYNAGYDWGSGWVAAGAASVAAVIIVLLFILVATSRHHEHE